MPKFVLAYHGGGMAQTQEARAEAMAAWGGWFGQLGSAVVDAGNPTVAAKTLRSDGSVVDGGGPNPLSGYSLVTADSLDAAVTLAKGCPVLSNGGSVEVAEAVDVM